MFIKIPGTPEGLPAIEECTFAGIAINVTLLFSPEQYLASAEAHRAYRELLDSPRWGRLANEGARPQRLLWASTSTKNPDAPDVLYVRALAAPFTINTMPEKTLYAFADHGRVGDLMAVDGGDAEQTIADFATAGVDHQALAEQLQRDGAESFDKSWYSLLDSIASKHEQLTAGVSESQQEPPRRDDVPMQHNDRKEV